ncbi:MAG: serine hydrolase [bacterium]
MRLLEEKILPILREQPGQWGMASKDLTTDATIVYNEDKLFGAASVIKIPIIIEAYRQDRAGKISLSDPMELKAAEVVGGCGVLKVMHPGLVLSVRDVAALMITVSDNTATNMLIDLLGIDNINAVMQKMGCKFSILRRKLMMEELARRGIKNELAPYDVMLMMEALYRGTIVDRAACDDILEIMKKQQLNHKIPSRLPAGTVIAHKTGEDTGITHNAGIIYAPDHPFLLVLLSEYIPDEADGHQVIARIAKIAYEHFTGN